MTFLHPILAAAAVACVAVPIIIHILMRRRRKPVMWAAMRFLLEAYRQHRRRLRLEQLLLLAARCLVIALAGLAIARPLLGQAGLLGGRGAVTLYLLIDNGLASAALDEDGKPALERHKARAQALLDQLDTAAGDRAALIALGGPSQALVVPPSTSAAGVRDQIAGLAATDSATDLPGAIATVKSAVEESQTRANPGGRTVVAVMSDFLTGSADTEKKLAELAGPEQARGSLAIIASPPAARGPGNTSITALDPLQPVIVAPKREGNAPAQQSQVRIGLRRTGAGMDAAATTVRLAVQPEGAGTTATPAGQAVVRWNPGQTEASATASIGIPAGPAGSVVLTAAIDTDAVAGDNVFRRPIEVRQSLKVGLIAPRRTGAAKPGIEQFDPADWFRLAMSPSDPSALHSDSEFEAVDIEPAALDAARLAGLDAAVVLRPDLLPEEAWKRLRSFADSGGLVIVCPPAGVTVHLWADAMVRDMALPWTVAREAKAYPEGVSPSADRGAAVGHDLLALIQGELKDLVLPVRVLKVLPVDVAAGAPAPQFKLSDGTPFIVAAHPGTRDTAAQPGGQVVEAPQRGLVVMIASALAFEWTDLQAKPLMVPMTYELVKQGVGQARGGRVDVAGSSPEVPARGVELRGVGETTPTVVRAQGGRTDQPLRHAGLWRALDESGATRGLVAVNADPAGGRTDAQPATAIGTWLAKAGGVEVQWLEGPAAPGSGQQSNAGVRSVLQRGDEAGRMALPLLIAALVLAVLELAMGRWFSHATVRPTAGGAAA